MREIKFRAWDDYHKIIIPNYLTQGEDFTFNGYDLTNNIHGVTAVMQFTGLNDKNGVEIYEGDIVSQFTLKFNCTVIFHNGSFGYWDGNDINYRSFISYSSNQWFDWKNCKSEHVEIIGNIYQNPELLTT